MERDGDEAELEAIFRALPDLLFVLDPDGRFIRYRAGREQDLYAPPSAFLGKTVADVMPRPIGVMLEDAQARLAAGEEIVRVEYSLLIEGTVKHYEARAVLDEARNTVFVTRDVTEQRIAQEERRALDRKMEEAQRLESLGVLAGGVAHDFNNLLAAILGGVDLLERHAPPGSPLEAPLDIVRQSAWRASELSRQLLAYAGKGRTETRSVDLGALVRDTAQLLDAALSKRAHLQLDLAHDVPPVHGDVAQLRQIVMNLVTNASDAIGEREGVVLLRTRAVPLDEPLGDAWTGVELSVTDDGCGMDDATRARMFDPFFSSKGVGRGLGLAAVLGIVRTHGGRIEVESEPGRGTRTRVLLPASDRPAEPLDRGRVGVMAPMDSATVLVVDDEAGVREVISRFLEDAGLSVLTAEDGRAALSVFASQPEIDAVVLDVTMPNLGGEETFRALRRLRPGLPVILTSGYDEHETMRLLRDASPPPLFLEKPFRGTALLDAVRASLARR